MNRARNIVIWVITIIFFSGTIFFIGVLGLWPIFIVLLILLVVAIILLCVKPGIMGIAPRASADVIQSEIRFTPVFQAEIRLISTNIANELNVLINGQDFTIGRNRDSSFVIDTHISGCVSRQHATIHFDAKDQCYLVIPHITPHGTRLNHELLMPKVPHIIKKGDILELADVRFVVKSAYY